MGELVIASEGELECDAKRLDGHDGDGADGRTDRDVYKRVLLSIHRRNSIDHDGGEDCDGQTVKEKALLISLSPATTTVNISIPG